MRFSTKCWSEHILSAYKATKNLKHPLYLPFNHKAYLCQSDTLLNSLNYKDYGFLFTAMSIDS